MWVLFIAFFPFGPPFYTMPQNSVLLGGVIGFLLNRVAAQKNFIAFQNQVILSDKTALTCNVKVLLLSDSWPLPEKQTLWT